MKIRVWWALALSLIALRSGAGQTISGRVTDSVGNPIPHVRVMVRPEGNPSDAALRVAITNERGEYRVALGTTGRFVVSALRIGFRPEAGMPTNVAGSEGAHLDVVMISIPLSLATVNVTTHPVRCLPLDDPEQSPDVRDWVQHAEDLIRARRAIELEYGYTAHVVSSHVDSRTGIRKVDGNEDFVQEPGDTRRIEREEATATTPTGGVDANGSTWWRIPEEGTLLSPTFTKRLCFDDVLIPTDSGKFDVQFSQVDAGPRETSLDGTFRMTAGGMISEILYRVRAGGARRPTRRPNPNNIRFSVVRHTPDNASRVYTSVDIDGESFPLVTLERILPGSGERRFTYSAFVRRK